MYGCSLGKNASPTLFLYDLRRRDFQGLYSRKSEISSEGSLAGFLFFFHRVCGAEHISGIRGARRLRLHSPRCLTRHTKSNPPTWCDAFPIALPCAPSVLLWAEPAGPVPGGGGVWLADTMQPKLSAQPRALCPLDSQLLGAHLPGALSEIPPTAIPATCHVPLLLCPLSQVTSSPCLSLISPPPHTPPCHSSLRKGRNLGASLTART